MIRKEIFTLTQLLEKLQNTIERDFADSYWVRAEISNVNNHYSGHCYLELIDSEDSEDVVKSKIQGNIWSSNYKLIRPFFETTTGYPLSSGMKILVKAHLQFSKLYGLSLVISDIDPSFTIGEIEIERQRVINKLQEEGMMGMNSTVQLPLLPRNIAVISTDSAAGYGDFMNHLHNNEYGYKFQTTLFKSPMQGEGTVRGIIDQLDKIANSQILYDAVIIIRGGGSPSDLRIFDNYDLAVEVAQFPLPVITGIGHDQDFHVIDMVAHTWLKTPTATADFLIDFFIEEESRIASLSQRLSLSLQSKLSNEKLKIELLEQRIRSNNPETILSKGYTLLLKEGKVVDKLDQIFKGDQISVMMNKGNLDCVVERVKMNDTL